jgi:hypothetical protein
MVAELVLVVVLVEVAEVVAWPLVQEIHQLLLQVKEIVVLLVVALVVLMVAVVEVVAVQAQ